MRTYGHAVGACSVLVLMSIYGLGGASCSSLSDDCELNLSCSSSSSSSSGSSSGTGGTAGSGGGTSTSSSSSSGGGGTGGGAPASSCDPALNPGPVDDTCGVFVAQDGTSTDGTKANPFGSLQAALDAAVANNTFAVYACEGTYDGLVQIQIPAGITLYGSLNCHSGWAPPGGAGSPKTLLTAPAGVAPVKLLAGTKDTVLQDLAVQAKDATDPGGSSIAMIASGSSAKLVRCDLTAGNGAAGSDGAAGVDSAGQAMSGEPGTNACANKPTPPISDPIGGTGGTNTCGGSALVGGTGGKGGLLPSGAGQDGAPGDATAGGAPGESGANGADGQPGTGGQGLGQISDNGYLGTDGTEGTAGLHGTSGGGGKASNANATCNGAGGGGGGAGGCGGEPGKGGMAGGSSIALLSLDATLSLDNVTIVVGDGGKGGKGGDGKLGQYGGNRGNGGMSGSGIAKGNAGGDGGNGGSGGPGGGGLGGHAVGIAFIGSAPVGTPSVTMGAAGVGGTGGTNGIDNGADGASGQRQETLSF